ncbi:hypothetical protein GCM10027277_46890 [Pseudoduganella ginsengisoli]|uniref:DUF2059 domain-containing protein n=1 Tax=Pseudoduganella ginsengisoli TaxID=1462440 RepID=A0A6L6Q3T8_9BURK|nr:DUF2059 domain-containing protein [Pseudoduganella ginsengisoli]MTW04124.1 DUF2059 domain-containing protein [Pseudoduganella ginsengisoli]
MKKLIAAAVLALAVPAASVYAADTGANDKTVAAAKELMAVMNMRAVTQASLQQMSQQLPGMMRQMMQVAIDSKKLSPEQARKALADMEKTLPSTVAAMNKTLSDSKMLEELEAETVAIYARNFTEDEMKQVIAFYRSPVGAKMLTKMPQLMQESMQASQKVVLPRMAKMIEGMAAELGK